MLKQIYNFVVKIIAISIDGAQSHCLFISRSVYLVSYRRTQRRERCRTSWSSWPWSAEGTWCTRCTVSSRENFPIALSVHYRHLLHQPI